MIKLVEIINHYKIYCDMDGVLTDFDRMFIDLIKSDKYKDGWEFQKKHGQTKMWQMVDDRGGLSFWSDMYWMPDGKKLWDYIKKYNDTEILSSPSRLHNSKIGKKMWVRRELTLSNGKTPQLKLYKARHKAKLSKPNHILIDDLQENISAWVNAGGIGILHTSADNTINELKKLKL